MEELFQYIWKFKLYPQNSLVSDTGSTIEIIDTGIQNRDTGPDFFNAKIKFDNTVWAGNIELHMRSSDWMRHGHDKDKRYDSVILNVVEVRDADIFRSNGEPIPQLVLPFPKEVREHYQHLVNNTSAIPCRDQLVNLDPFLFSSWRNALLTERLERKTEAIQQLLTQNQQNWEEAFYITLLRSFGLSVNNDAFERLARSLSLSFVQKHTDSLLQVEAFFFGQAGLLDVENPENSYLVLLQREFQFLQNKFSLKHIDKEAWRFLRLRPANFPHIRLSQVATLYHQTPALFAKIIDIHSPEEFYQLMHVEPSAYWQTHYDFESVSEMRQKRMGKTALQIALINAVVPMMFAYGKATGQNDLCDRALSLLESLKSEENKITREWRNTGVEIASAFDSQAIIQLQREYCDKKKCLYCRIGHRILSRK
ncbi:MAG: DUF2851 family protein [Bacteroidales bacterium]|nr:DUF2851 family protein [Bacteroidales bacterium]